MSNGGGGQIVAGGIAVAVLALLVEAVLAGVNGGSPQGLADLGAAGADQRRRYRLGNGRAREPEVVTPCR